MAFLLYFLGKVETWEGLLTFLFFPATVWTAYVADRRLFCYKYMSKSYRMNKHGIVVQSEKGDIESRAQETFKVIMIKKSWGKKTVLPTLD